MNILWGAIIGGLIGLFIGLTFWVSIFLFKKFSRRRAK
jgi:hypothetical protein